MDEHQSAAPCKAMDLFGTGSILILAPVCGGIIVAGRVLLLYDLGLRSHAHTDLHTNERYGLVTLPTFKSLQCVR